MTYLTLLPSIAYGGYLQIVSVGVVGGVPRYVPLILKYVYVPRAGIVAVTILGETLDPVDINVHGPVAVLLYCIVTTSAFKDGHSMTQLKTTVLRPPYLRETCHGIPAPEQEGF